MKASEFTITRLWEELREGEVENDKRRRCGEAALKRYQGPSAVVADDKQLSQLDGENDPENFIYELVTFIEPQLVYSTPRCTVTAPEIPLKDDRQREVKLTQVAVNQWGRATGVLEFMASSALDPLFGFAACHVTPKRSELGYRSSLARAEWPEVRRVSDRNLWRDPAALSPEECKWWAMRTVIDRDDLLELAEEGDGEGWNVEEIRALGDKDLGSHYHTPEQRKLNLERDEIELVQMWWPKVETGKPEDGEIGTVFTLAVLRSEPPRQGGRENVSAVHARDPQPYVGAPSGPFVTCGVHRIKDSPFTLAPIVALDSQNREHNAQVRAELRRCRKRKKLVVTTSQDETFSKAVESAEEGSVLQLKKVPPGSAARDFVAEVEVEGTTPQGQASVQWTGEMLRRVAGIGETQSGNARGDATATEVATASHSSAIRVDRIKERWRAYIEQIYLAVAGYLATSSDVRMWLERDIVEDAGLPIEEGVTGIEYVGGGMTWEEFESLSLSIDVSSIERVTDAQVQARMMQAHTMTLNAVPLMVQVPDAKWWADEFDRIGDALNVPHMGDHVGGLVESIQALMQAGVIPVGQPEATPRVDVGGGAPQQNGRQERTPSSPQGQNRTPGLSGASNTVPLPKMGGA